MIMTTTIRQALRPFLMVYFFIGLGSYPLKRSERTVKWIIYISILYSLTVWFVYGCLLYYLVRSLSLKTLYISTVIITVMNVTINIITTITTAILSVCYYKKFRTCMDKLDAVNDTLEKLGTSHTKMHRKMHIWSKRIVIGWLIFIVAINFYDTLWWLSRKETAAWAFVVPHIINHCLHVNAFVDLVFITFLWYVGSRFDEVNKHIRYLLVKEEHILRSTWNKSVVIIHQYTLYKNNYKRVLWSSMHLHLELCHIARKLNMMFGMQMTFEMASYLIFLTGLCYYLYEFIIKQKHREEVPVNLWFNIFFWVFVYVARLYTINYICEGVSANEIDKIIHQLTNTLRYADIWKEIYQFALQSVRHPLKFTGIGLFNFGNEFLQKICMMIVTRLWLSLCKCQQSENSSSKKKPISYFITSSIMLQR